jgi:hypothetical protein
MTDLPKYLNYRQAMIYMNIKSYQTLHSYIADGLEVIVLGRKRFITQEAIDKYMASKVVV